MVMGNPKMMPRPLPAAATQAQAPAAPGAPPNPAQPNQNMYAPQQATRSQQAYNPGAVPGTRSAGVGPNSTPPPTMAGNAPNLTGAPPPVFGFAPPTPSNSGVQRAGVADQTAHARNTAAGAVGTYAAAPVKPPATPPRNIPALMDKYGNAQAAPPSPASQFGDAVRMAGAAGNNQALWDRLGIGNPPPPPVPANPTTTMAPPPPAPVAAVEAGAASAGAAKAPRDSRGKKKEDTSGGGLSPDAARLTADDDNDGVPNNQDPDSSYNGLTAPGEDAGGQGVTPPSTQGTPELTPTGDPRTPNDEGSDGGQQVHNPRILPTEQPIGKTPDGRTIYRDANTGKHVFQGKDGNWYDADTTSWGQGAPGNAGGHGYEQLSDEEKAQHRDAADTLAGTLASRGIAVDSDTITAILDDGYEVDSSGNVKDPRTGAIRGNLSDPNFALAHSASNEAKARARAKTQQESAAGDAKFQEWIQKMLDEAGSSGTMDESQINDYVNKQHQRNAYEEARSLSAMMAGSGGLSPESFMGRSADVSQAYGTQGAADEAKTRLQLQMNNLQAEMQQSQAKMQAMAMAAQNAQSKEQRQWALDAQYAMQKKQAQLQQQMMQFQAELTRPDFGDVIGGAFTNVLGGGLNLLTMGGLGKLFGWGK